MIRPPSRTRRPGGVSGAAVDVLVPAFGRPAALAVTLAGLGAQSHRPLRIVISDQTETEPIPIEAPEVDAVVRVLRRRGIPVQRHRHLPARGMAEHRAWLLHHARAPYALFVDDDVLVDPDLVDRLVRAIRRERCGFVGSALVGLSHVGDVRPDEERIEFWDGPVRPERVAPDSAAWARHRLHNAANLEHLRTRRGDGDHHGEPRREHHAEPRRDHHGEPRRDDHGEPRRDDRRDRLYKVAWVGGCVLYDVSALRAVGGFEFWRRLPERHAGEDVLAQLRVMAAFGGAGLFPSGAYHLELPTTIADRRVEAPRVLGVPRRPTPHTRRRRHRSLARSPFSRQAARSSSR